MDWLLSPFFKILALFVVGSLLISLEWRRFPKGRQLCWFTWCRTRIKADKGQWQEEIRYTRVTTAKQSNNDTAAEPTMKASELGGKSWRPSFSDCRFSGQVVQALWTWGGAAEIHPRTRGEGSAITVLWQITLPKLNVTWRWTVIPRAMSPWLAARDRLGGDDSRCRCAPGSAFRPGPSVAQIYLSHVLVKMGPLPWFVLGPSWKGEISAAVFLCNNFRVRPRCQF